MLESRTDTDTNEPTFEWGEGPKEWFLNGKLHRKGDKPAWVDADGTIAWWAHGEEQKS